MTAILEILLCLISAPATIIIGIILYIVDLILDTYDDIKEKYKIKKKGCG